MLNTHHRELNDIENEAYRYTFHLQLGKEGRVSNVIWRCPTVCDDANAAVMILGALFCQFSVVTKLISP